jgi:hypothetical protein
MKTQAYFKDIQKVIIENIRSSTRNILVAVAWLTDNEIFDELCLKAKSGINIELLLIDDNINREMTSIDHSQLIKEGGNVIFIPNSIVGAVMHHKFCIIDESIIITGSYNWSNRAKYNDENILVISDDKKLAKDFKDEFELIKLSRQVHQTKDEDIDLKRKDSIKVSDKEKGETIVPCVLKDNPTKHGYSTPDFKKIVIPCEFEYTFPFEGNYAKVLYEGKIRYVTKEGYIIKPEGLINTLFGEFPDGIACAFLGSDIYSMSGPCGFIEKDKEQLVVIPFIYERANEFSDGLAAVKKYKEKWGFIDSKGNEFIPFIYEYAESFKNGNAVVKRNGKWGIIDKSNNEVMPFIYDGFISKPNYTQYHIIQLESKRGYFDRKSLKIVIPIVYDDAKFFSEELAAVCIGKKWGFINLTGDQVISLKYDKVLDFSEGLAAVKQKGKWGYINSEDKIIIPFKYSLAESFINGKAKIQRSFTSFGGLIKSKTKEGKIDLNGNEFW